MPHQLVISYQRSGGASCLQLHS